jgi:glycosyltransferase involved in cell wall biosynthesis
VQHIVRFPKNRGLAKAFMAGLEASLAAGADIVVNLDADNQYCAEDIPKLVQPILEGRAEMVIGARPISEIQHFSFFKKQLQKMGSWLVRVASKTNVVDAPSGFRALSRNAALRLNVFNEYTYTLETIIQAGRRGITVLSVPIRTNGQLRPSRLVKSTLDYVRRSILTILRIFMTYCPMRFFFFLGAIPFSLGLLLGIRWLVLFWNIHPASHIPSLVLTAILLIFGLQLWVVGLIADLLAVNRSLLEDVQFRIRRAQLPASLNGVEKVSTPSNSVSRL